MSAKKLALFSLFFAFSAFPDLTMAAFQYAPMETIPGSTAPKDFCEYIQAVYKFGIWTVGIAAMFMIMFGGYAYILSAGNNASMQKAKGFIFDALIGMTIALTAYLLLYIINPELLEIKIFCEPATTPPGPTQITPSAQESGAQPLPPTQLATDCENYEDAFKNASNGDPNLKCLLIAIANQESGCNPNSVSSHNACGMMQIKPGSTANPKLDCEGLMNNPEESIRQAAALLKKAKDSLTAKPGFAMGTSYGQSGTSTPQFGSFVYDAGNDDIIASYNAGYGNNTTNSKKGPFTVSTDCPSPPYPTQIPSWQCDINPGGFTETQKYVMRVQDLQKQCLTKQ